MATVRILNRRLRLPGNRAARTAIGGGLVAGGVLGFLPVLGFWMVPAGLVVLSVDSAAVRRLNRRATVAVVRRWHLYRARGGADAAEAAD